MTREEAIKILKEDGCGYCTWQSINPYGCENKECELKEALDMAIQALSQEPCDDAISRKSILKYIDDWWSDSRDDIEDLIIYITYLPSVTQKSGKWIRTPLLTCDRCNKINKSGEETDYCPNCGAKMESGDK